MDPQEFDDRFRLTPDLWLPSVQALCRALGLPSGPLRLFPDGSNLVVALAEQWVIKVFPPFHRHQWESERSVLPRLAEGLPVPVPSLEAEGSWGEDWTYLVMSLLPGESLETAWPRCGPSERAALMAQIGDLMAAVHSLPIDDLHTLPPDWDVFLTEQIAGCRARHERLGMPSWMLEGMDPFLDDALLGGFLDGPRVILTGEYTPFNLLVRRGSRGIRLSGMIDLGDAMIGPAVYDLLGPSLFLAGGEAALVRPLIERSRWLSWPLISADRRGLMALALLHRYSNLNAQIRIPDWQARVSSLEELSLLLWPC